MMIFTDLYPYNVKQWSCMLYAIKYRTNCRNNVSPKLFHVLTQICAICRILPTANDRHPNSNIYGDLLDLLLYKH